MAVHPAVMVMARMITVGLDGMKDDERLRVFEAIALVYCPHCGTKHGPPPEDDDGLWRPCQCWNDD